MSDATGTVLEQIRVRRGRLTPTLVVDESRPDDAPLHHRFEWEDSTAAEMFRRYQAAQIIRSVHISFIAEPGRDPVQVRAFLPVRDDDDDSTSSYLPSEQVAQSPAMVAILREQMKREWLQLKRKYQDHETFWAMVRADESGAA